MKKQDILTSLLKAVLPENLDFPEVPLSDFKVVGLGKAAPAHLKYYFESQGMKDHLIVTKLGVPSLGLNCLFGGHPNYSKDSFLNGDKLIEWINQDERDVLFVVTGGASSVVEKLKDEFLESEVQKKMKELLSSSTSIHEINEYRKSISLIKGGGLKKRCGGRKIHTWVVKDVPGDDLTAIGSGPTLDNGDTNYSLLSAYKNLEERVKELELTFIKEALDEPLDDGIKFLLKRGTTVSGGELTIDVKGSGRGGRNTHFVLSAALEIFGANSLGLNESELDKVFIASLATDGDDGNSGVAGGFMDHPSWKLSLSLGLNPQEALSSSDSASFLERLGNLYVTGITGTNIMDLRLVHIP